MKRLIFLAFINCGCLSVFSQAYTIKDLTSLSDQMTFETSKKDSPNGLQLDQIDGSPYLIDEFTNGEVIIDDSIRVEDVPLRYNIYNDKMQFKSPQEQVLEFDNSARYYNFSFGTLSFLPLAYIEDGNTRNGLLELLADGQIKLYKKYHVEFKEATKAIGYQEAKPDCFIRLDDEYLIAEGDAIPQVFKNTKMLVEELKSYKPNIDKYIKKEKIRVKTENGLIQLIRHCNQ